MPIRSVAELLPAPFSELTLDDVHEIVRRVGEERETIFFERKSIPRQDLVAKSCAAFANTLGGLLLVGIPDNTDNLTGFAEPHIGDAPVWVKDVLRPRVTPLPPFRARTFNVGDDRHALLVLVERSSTTPHLLTRQGAIYIRTPGSSDPVGLSDHPTLLELVHRGEAAATESTGRAVKAVTAGVPVPYTEVRLAWSLGLSPTGTSAETERQLAYDPDLLDRLGQLLPPPPAGPFDPERVHGTWEQARAQVFRVDRSVLRPDQLFAAQAWTDGTIAVHQGMCWPSNSPAPEDDRELTRDALLEWMRRTLGAAKDLLLEAGAHGDLRVVLRAHGGYDLYWDRRYHTVLQSIQVAGWTDVESNIGRDDDLLRRFESDIGRALGSRPIAP